MLAALAVVLTVLAPRLMARLEIFRREPRAALLGWQAVSLAALVSAVSAAPLAVQVLALGGAGWAAWAVAPARREHRLLVDALGETVDAEVRVLAQPTPTAYCLPGLRRRVVVTEGTLRTLPTDELDAVLAHERAHLRERHDLELEFFAVLHQSAPSRLQVPEALREVRLLVEVLADVGATRARMAALAKDDVPRGWPRWSTASPSACWPPRSRCWSSRWVQWGMSPTRPRPHQPYRVIVVCTGNICRSPMGEFILRELFEAAGLGDRVEVDSAGTTSWEAGNPADRRTLEVLRRNGHDDFGGVDHVARQFERSWIDGRDLVLAADSGHLDDLRQMARTEEQRSRIRLFREFDPAAVAAGELDMDDPWYGDGAAFDQTYAEVTAAAAGVVEHVRHELATRDAEATRR